MSCYDDYINERIDAIEEALRKLNMKKCDDCSGWFQEIEVKEAAIKIRGFGRTLKELCCNCITEKKKYGEIIDETKEKQ